MACNHIQKMQRLIHDFYNHEIPHTAYDAIVDKVHQFRQAIDTINKHVHDMTDHILQEHYYQQLATDCAHFSEDSLITMKDDANTDHHALLIIAEELKARQELPRFRSDTITHAQRLFATASGSSSYTHTKPQSIAPWIITLSREYQSIIDSWHKQNSKSPSIVSFDKHIGSADEQTKKTLWLLGMLWMCRKHHHNLGFISQCIPHLIASKEYMAILKRTLMNELQKICTAIVVGDVDAYNKHACTICQVRQIAQQYPNECRNIAQELHMFPPTSYNSVFGHRFRGLYICNKYHPINVRRDAYHTEPVVYLVNHELPLSDRDVACLFHLFEDIVKCDSILAVRARVSKSFMDTLNLVANDSYTYSPQYQRVVDSHLFMIIVDRLTHSDSKPRLRRMPRATITL